MSRQSRRRFDLFQNIFVTDFCCPSFNAREQFLIRVLRGSQTSSSKLHYIAKSVLELFVSEDGGIHPKSVVKIEFPDNFAAEFDVGDLVFADRDDERLALGAVDNNIGGLQHWIAEEAVGVEVFVFH